MIYYKQLRPVKTIMHQNGERKSEIGGAEGVGECYIEFCCGRENRPRARIIVDSWKHEL